jgi:predicted ATPase/class 3 adenylate cyclase
MEALGVYIPTDRRQAMTRGKDLPDRTRGAALFADISGFTPLTEALVRELGPQRGAEELTRHLNLVYDTLIAELHRYGGSVIGFSGDAITCWLDENPSADSRQVGLRATACALAMQQRMGGFTSVTVSSGKTYPLAMKAAVATGAARRFVVGDPEIYVIDVLAGATLDRLAQAEHQAEKGEVVLDPAAVASVDDRVQFLAWRHDDEAGGRFGVAGELASQVTASPWQSIPPDALGEEQVRPWLLPPVYERLHAGRGEFLAELRPAVALFLRFGGIDYDGDEAAGAKLDAYIRWVQTVLVRYDGYLLQLTIGDKGSYLYAAFGAPIAHEDDAVRAASAALELQEMPDALHFIDRVQIGISRGRMRTGAYGGTKRRTYGVLGDEVNLAARLMQAAAPGQIMVSQAAQQVAGDTFVWQSLPPLRVKGKTEPVTAFSPVRAKKRRVIRLHAADYALPMVGREAELELIEQKLALVSRGQGQIIGITGEAGIGKTRLVAEAMHVASDQQLAGYVSECESYGTNTSYLVWRAIWRAFFDIDPSWEVADQVSALEKHLERVDPALVPRLPLLGAVLNLSIPDNDLTRSFDAKLRKASLEALLVDCLRAWAGRTTLLFVLEDCHWFDPLSHGLVEVIGRAVANLPVLLMMAYRPPELERLQAPRISRLAHFTEIELSEFTPQEAERLIALKLSQFFGPQTEVPPGLVERITARAQGNPFYIEELLNYLRDRGIAPQDSEALERLDLPTSLHSLILSRLDQRTESQKITLRVASVIGRLFRAALLWGMYPELGAPERVKADLEALCRRDLTVPDTPEPELSYLFRHIVTQEVAYESLPYATRAMLHEQLAQYIERTYSEPLEQYVDLLAYHYDRSQNEDKKREYLRKAGEAAQADYANEAAMNYYQRVLPLLPPGEQVPIMRKLGEVLQLVGKWSEADDLYQQGLVLAQRLDDRQALARCQVAKGELLRKRGLYADASEWLDRAWVGFKELGDKPGVARVLKEEGTLAAMQGELEVARARYEESLAIRRELEDKSAVADLLNNLAIVARFRGDYQAARALNEEALDLRTRLGDKRAIANSLNNLGEVLSELGEYETARTRVETAVGLYREIGDRWEIANVLHTLANAIRDQGDYAASRSLYEESLTMLWELGERWRLASVLGDMGGLAALQGQPKRALRLSGAAAVLREAIGAPLPPAERDILEELLGPARQALGEAAATSAEAEGRAMSLEQAVEYARSNAD